LREPSTINTLHTGCLPGVRKRIDYQALNKAERVSVNVTTPFGELSKSGKLALTLARATRCRWLAPRLCFMQRGDRPSPLVKTGGNVSGYTVAGP